MSENIQKSKVLSIRLNNEERVQFQKDAAAAGMSFSAYARHCFFHDKPTTKRKIRRKHPVKDHKILGKLLAWLGRSNIGNNLNQIAKAAHCGALILTPELKAMIIEACADIRQIKDMLIKALGLGV